MLATIVVAGVTVGAGFSGGSTDTAPDTGYHYHLGSRGEEDVNVCSDAVPAGQAHCLSHRRVDAEASRARPSPTPLGAAAANGPAGTLGNNGAYDPSFLRSAYVTPSVSGGAGQTVAIVDAYDDPSAESDLSSYRTMFGLSPCTTANGCFKKVNEFGGGSYPSADSGWGEEISLDLDMVSAVCPNCKITLVEASSAYLSDLGTAVNTAVSLGANVVSNSYGGGEYSGETTDSNTYYNHPGVAVVASSGDSGYGVEFPAASNTVTAVGGTSLNQLTSTGTRNATETAWSGAGSGCSAYMRKPSWQHDTGCGHRTVADVSAVADPNTGVWVYDTYGTGGSWLIFGGTSVAAPIVGSLYALAGSGASSNPPPSYPYADPAALNDVTSGSNGSCGGTYLCTALSGYDGPTGLGTPNGTAAFTGAPVTPTAPGAPTLLSATAGNASVSLTWSPTTSGSAPITSYNVYRGTSSGGEMKVQSGVAGTTYTDTGLTNGTRYFYTVTAVSTAGESLQSSELAATPLAPPMPSAPQNVSATASNASVSLSWIAPSTGGPSFTYNVSRATTSGGTKTGVVSGLTTTSYTDTGLTNGTTYYYTVTATNSTATGPASNQASATPQATATVPGASTLTVATSPTRGVVLTWNVPTTGGSTITSYRIYRGTSSGGVGHYTNLTPSSCSAGTCTWTNTSTTSGTTYYYEVAARNSIGTGPLSNEAHGVAK